MFFGFVANITQSIKKMIALGFLLGAFISSAQGSSLQHINRYLQNIDKVAIDFTQQDSSGASFQGTLIIDKPHKFRCNYYAPYPLMIIGGKNYVSVYDFKMKSLSRIKARENPLNFLLLGEIDTTNRFEVLGEEENNGALSIRLKEKKSGKISRIIFDKASGEIRSLSIIEADNIIELTFHRHKNLSAVDPKLFQLKDPDLYQKPKQLGYEELYARLTY